MLRHVQEQHSGFFYKCLICHKVLSRAQVHGQCPGRYRDTEIFHRETGARGWLAKQLFQQYKDNKLNDQWEELFKAPPPPPRRISPLPRTPPSTPPPTDRNLTVMTVIDSGRKRKAPTPDVPPKKKSSFTLDDQEWTDIQLFDPNDEQFGENDLTARTKNVWFPPPTRTLTSSSSSSESEREPDKGVKSRVVVDKKRSSDGAESDLATKSPVKNQKDKPSGKGKSIKTCKPSETKKLETKTQTPQASKNSKDSGKANQENMSNGKEKSIKKPKPSKTDKTDQTKKSENPEKIKSGKTDKSIKEAKNQVQGLKIDNKQSNQIQNSKIIPTSEEAQVKVKFQADKTVEVPKETMSVNRETKTNEPKQTEVANDANESQDIDKNDNREQDETAQAVAVLQACLNQEVTNDNHDDAGIDRFDTEDHPIIIPTMNNEHPVVQDEESEFQQLVTDAIRTGHKEEIILNNPNNPGTQLSDKINHYYTTFDFLQKIQESKIVLNIGGQLFITSELTLRVVPNSIFGLMFAQGCPLRPSNRMFRFDRDPSHFRIILMYLRNGAQLDIELLPYERRYLLELLTEARFYCLEGLVSLIRERLRRTTGCDKY